MEIVGAGLGYHVDRTARVAAALRPRGGLRGEFHDRINWKDGTGNARDPALINRRDVVPEVVVVHPIDLPVDLVGASSVERATAAHIVAAETWGNGNQLREVASVQRNVLHHVVGNGHG